MTTVISGTNRRNSEALKFAKAYYKLLCEKQGAENVKLIDLIEMPGDVLHADMYSESGQSEYIRKVQDEAILDAERIVYVIPEYNGGVPGAMKLFIDALSVREFGRTFAHKACLVGVATGRAGNTRGLDHLTNMLHYCGTNVMPMKQPFSSIKQLINAKGQIHDVATLAIIEKQVDVFLKY